MTRTYTRFFSRSLFLCVGMASTCVAQTTTTETQNRCLLEALKAALPSSTAAEIRSLCEPLPIANVGATPVVVTDDAILNPATANDPELLARLDQPNITGPVSLRESVQDFSAESRYVLTSHKANYLLPFTYNETPNTAPFEAEGFDPTFNDLEMQFQLSVKFPLDEDFIVKDSTLWFGYTIRSFWQAYEASISRPFRETNHEPEIFWDIPSTIEFGGVRNVSNQLIFNHNSNGQAGELSRSWNRIMLQNRFETDYFGFNLQSWYRIPDQEEDYPGDPEGDDNPDIESYLGNVQFDATWWYSDNHSLSLMLRNSFGYSDYTSGELSWTFPIHERVNGVVKYFNGYGESLIDYDVRTERFGVGIQISEWF